MTGNVLTDAVEVANVASSQAAIALDTMLQLQKEKDSEYLATIERIEQRNAEEKAAMRKHYQRIIVSISLVLLLIVGSLVGGIIYLVSNFDIGFEMYQEISAEGGGDSTIEDGIHINGNPLDDYNAE